jgi:aspartate-semialdehyde dehydrogenase
MTIRYNVAIVGATGAAGRETIQILAERNFPVARVFALASDASLGKKISFGNENLTVDRIDDIDWNDVDIVFSSAGSEVTELLIKTLTKGLFKRPIVIDKTSLYRLDEQVPLIIPEINIIDIGLYTTKNIISNPNCCVIPLALTLKPLDNFNKIKRIVISTYQSMSGAGTKGMEALYEQTKKKFAYLEEHDEQEDIGKNSNIAFNVIPKIGSINNNGYSGEENKIILELGRILGSDIKITATSVRVPVFIGHGFSVNVEFEQKFSILEVENILSNAAGITLTQDPVTPIEISGLDNVFVSRLRPDYSSPNALNMWIITDNLRKGAALNAVQIAENLINLL